MFHWLRPPKRAIVPAFASVGVVVNLLLLVMASKDDFSTTKCTIQSRRGICIVTSIFLGVIIVLTGLLWLFQTQKSNPKSHHCTELVHFDWSPRTVGLSSTPRLTQTILVEKSSRDAIQHALDQTSYGVILLPPGDIFIDQTLRMHNDNVILRGRETRLTRDRGYWWNSEVAAALPPTSSLDACTRSSPIRY